MIELTTDVEGDRQVIARLSGMTDVIRARLAAALETSGGEVRDAAASRAPSSRGDRSPSSRRYGPLRSKIKARLSGRGDALVETVSLGTAFYGRFQETGLDTTRRAPRKRGIIGVRTRVTKTGTVVVSARRGLMRRPSGGEQHKFHLPAHPFMRPAFLSLQERIVGRIRDSVAGATVFAEDG